jgi:ParB family chromosome partitioning protein
LSNRQNDALLQIWRGAEKGDENLCGTNLTAAERALFTRRRKLAYEAQNPETKHGATGGGHDQSRQVGDSAPRFTADTAAKTGQSERVVQRDATRGERVAPEVLTQIAGTKLDTGRTLDELASVPKDEQAAKVADLAAEWEEPQRSEHRRPSATPPQQAEARLAILNPAVPGLTWVLSGPCYAGFC